jgi:hypothetical protein
MIKSTWNIYLDIGWFVIVVEYTFSSNACRFYMLNKMRIRKYINNSVY